MELKYYEDVVLDTFLVLFNNNDVVLRLLFTARR